MLPLRRAAASSSLTERQRAAIELLLAGRSIWLFSIEDAVADIGE